MTKVTLVHPHVPLDISRRLGMPALEDVVTEQLDVGRPLQGLDAIQVRAIFKYKRNVIKHGHFVQLYTVIWDVSPVHLHMLTRSNFRLSALQADALAMLLACSHRRPWCQIQPYKYHPANKYSPSRADHGLPSMLPTPAQSCHLMHGTACINPFFVKEGHVCRA